MKKPTKTSKLLNIRPPRWAFIYLIIAFVLQYMSPRGTVLYIPFEFLGTVLLVIGFIVMMWAWWIFQKEKTAVCPTSKEDRKLIDYGPYRFSRNPMYLGMTFMLVGVALLIGTIPMLFAPIAFVVTINTIFIPYEELQMKELFGEKYLPYKEKVRAWL